MWERFSYYGMRAILLLFMTAAVAEGGLGWDAAKAGPIYGLYTALVYLTALPGGWIADRLLGQRRSVLVGGIIIALGHVSLTFHSLAFFFLGLCPDRRRHRPAQAEHQHHGRRPLQRPRTSGATPASRSSTWGSTSAPSSRRWSAASWRRASSSAASSQSHGINPANSWHWGFGAAAVGMTLGLVQYVLGGRRLGTVGLRAGDRADPATRGKDRRNLLIGVVVFAGAGRPRRSLAPACRCRTSPATSATR